MVHTSDFLTEIVCRRRTAVQQERAATDLASLRRRAEIAREGREPQRLRAKMTSPSHPHIIGEFKRASPSRGALNLEAHVAETVTSYQAAGASAVSILTEPDFFRGSLDDLRTARAATDLPILRKDFIIDEFQIFEAAVAGAESVLLIVALLSGEHLSHLHRAAENLGLDALVEVHSDEEMQRAVNCGAKLIGVNNRDLRTFSVSIETSIELASRAPEGVTLISESGLSTSDDIRRLVQYGYHGFLIGESLMRASDPKALIQSLRAVQIEEQHRHA